MLIKLRHEKHGFTHAYTPLELERLLAQGWVKDEEDKPAEEAKRPILHLPKRKAKQ